MMELKDFEKFLEFTTKQITILKEKEVNEYKDDSWKIYEEEDLLDDLIDQLDRLEWSEEKEYKQRRLLHIANYAFFIWHKLQTD